MRKYLGILVMALGIPAAAQDQAVMRAAMMLSGAAAEEDVDASVVDLLESRRGRPVEVNSNRLRSSAILSDYQVAVIRDYRAASGDILSWEELSLLEGFTKETVEALKPFLSLRSSSLPGAVDTVRTKAQALLRGTLTSAGGKVKVTGRSWRAGGAVRCASGFKSWDGTFFGEASFRNHRVVAGDYRVRFAEGLGLWTGFSMESLSTVDAFLKRAQGISPVWSFTSSGVQRGLAYEFSSRHWRAQAFGAMDKSFGARGEYLGKRFQAGFTVASGLLLSADARLNLRGNLLSGEVACKGGAWAGKASGQFPLGESFRLAAQGRVIPSRYSGKKNGEYALAAGLDWMGESRRHKASFTADASLLPVPGTDPRRLQVRGYATWDWQASSLLAVNLRLTERYRNYESPRTDVRADLKMNSGTWLGAFRLEAVRCEKWGFLTYLEGGYKKESVWAYLRVTGFIIDSWNDRIYVYERDAPGSFSVPAYYGRGVSLSATGAFKWHFGAVEMRAYLRAAGLFRTGRPFAPTLNLQLQCGL
ncbi:MAG: hypothetical protein IJU21_05980 [Bacteroidales bacterium]|nr:hypothetical protein [Bacteroidales bacterium]